jgi:hypothetical protein
MKHVVAGLCSILLAFLAAACDSTYQTGSPIAPGVSQPSPIGTPGTGPTPIPGTSIAPGAVIEGATIDRRDPECFYNWDASGRCKQYNLTAPEDGLILATLRWPGPSRGLYDPDVFIVAPDGAWVYAADPWPEKHASLPVKSGQTYSIVVLCYGESSQTFALVVDLQTR